MYKKAFQNVFVVLMVVAMLTATIGCDQGNFSSRQEAVDDTSPGGTNLMVRPHPDFILRILDSFESRGYKYAPEHVATVEFATVLDGMSDSLHGTITYYPMVCIADAEESVAYIEYVQTDVVDWVQPFIVSFVEPPEGDGFKWFAEGLWSKSFIPTRTDSGKYRATDMAASPNGFGACWLAGSVGGCTAAAIACTASGPGWPICAGAGCAGSIIGAEITCAIISWLS